MTPDTSTQAVEKLAAVLDLANVQEWEVHFAKIAEAAALLRALAAERDEVKKRMEFLAGRAVMLEKMCEDSLKEDTAQRTSARRSALEEAIEACGKQAVVFGSYEYSTGQPLASFSERHACWQCASAIRALLETTNEEK
jgi:hypothetical protein